MTSAVILGWVLVIFDQSMPKLRCLTCDEVSQEFPDGIRRRGATGDEVVDLHNLMQWVHLIQGERQFRVVRDVSMHKAWLGEIHLGQATTQIQVVTLRGKTTIDGTGADGDEDFAVLAELAQHVHVLCVADTAFD